VTVLFVALVSYLVARRFSRPIRNLTQIADNISRGNLRASIAEVNRSDEIGGLARAVERLTASVKLAMERLSKA
jgi:methyl-accepting chemotaxis protein